jgi:hypothetical protein
MVPRILSLAILALLSAGCAARSDSNGDPTAAQSFIAVWRQFLELDTPPASATPTALRSSATGGRASGSAHSGQTAEIDQVANQIGAVYVDAGAFITGFPSAEDTFRTVPTRFSAQLAKIRENKSNADAATLGRRLNQLSDQANQILERQHTRFITLQSNFNQKLEATTKSAAEIEKRCAQIQGVADVPVERAQACSKFYDASSMIKAKAELVAVGFANLDKAYQETRQTIQDLTLQAKAAPAKK